MRKLAWLHDMYVQHLNIIYTYYSYELIAIFGDGYRR